MTSLRVLALNPFHAGSHAAFLDGWLAHSRHEFTTLNLPGRHWKWRMRHAAVTFARQVRELTGDWDVVFGTDMFNLAEFRGLSPDHVARLPTVVYFHENQFTYPVRQDEPRDLHFGMTNVASAIAADAIWFNSSFHRDEFFEAARETLSHMPDDTLSDELDGLPARTRVLAPGIVVDELDARPTERPSGPLRVLWVSRWEHDKDPETFFAALRLLADDDVPFELRVLGESYSEQPECFEAARSEFRDRIVQWGFAPSRAEYRRQLVESDVVVSTARHEFFGIGVVEAVAAGCRPLVPRSLAYPEVLGASGDWFHDGTAADVASRLRAMAVDPARISTGMAELSNHMRECHGWPSSGTRLDDAISDFITS